MQIELLGWEFKKSQTDEKIRAAYLAPTNDDAAFVIGQNYYGYNVHQLSLDQTFENENDLIRKYRDISLHPEVDCAITDIVNEAIVGDNESSPIEIVLDDLKQPESIKTKIREEFEYLIKLLDFNSESYEIFRKWYVDGRLFYHIIIDKNAKKCGIKELRYVSPLHIKKIREEVNKTIGQGIEVIDKIKEYYVYSRDVYKSKTVGIRISKDSICYVTSGLVDEDKNTVYSYLHKAIKPTNQLRMIEDAVIIYRLSRAPERRAFYVDVGAMPTQKAADYVRNLSNMYKNKMVYDVVTGEVKDTKNITSMLEDYWLPTRGDGRGTKIDTISGAQNLGQLDDVEYFKKKLYMALGVPYSRVSNDGQTPFQMGRASEITRDELKYSKFISRLRKRFSKLFSELLRTQLLLKQIITEDEWEEFEENITFNFISDMFFKEFKDSEILKERVATLDMVREYVGTYFSMENVRKKILQMTDEEIDETRKQIEKEKKTEPELIAKFQQLMAMPDTIDDGGVHAMDANPEPSPRKSKNPTTK